VCVLHSGRLEAVPVFIDVTTLDTTTYRGQPFSRAFPVDSTYAGNASWYLETEPTDVVPVATFQGVTVFAEPRAHPQQPEVIYLPTRPGCEFQPYVRGGYK
jgi:hypothetical protein